MLRFSIYALFQFSYPHILQGWNIFPYIWYSQTSTLYTLYGSFATYFVLFIIPDKFKTHFLQII